MKLSAILLAAGALLALPSTAAAQYGPTPVVGSTYCDNYMTHECFTPQPGDYIHLAFDIPNQSNWQVDRYLFTDIAVPNKLRPQHSAVISFAAGPTAAGYVIVQSINQPQEGLLAGYCAAFESVELRHEGVAKDDTPASLFAACAFTRRESDPAPAPTAGTPITEPVSVAPAVAKLQTCMALPVGKSRVAVTSTGVACYSARGIMARYIKSGTEPDGYVCVTAASGRQRAATCASAGRAARRIVGKWRR